MRRNAQFSPLNAIRVKPFTGDMNSLQNFREHFFSRRNSRPEFKGDTLQESELNALFVQQGGFKKWLIDKTKKV